MRTILIVDDDAHIRELLHFYLEREGYVTISARDGEEALELLETETIHLAIVDIMMPRMDGYQLCKEIREYYDIPVMMLTAKGEISDKAKAYDVGTDDYVVKPFEPKEVLFRMRALLRRFQMTNEEVIKIGELTINRKSFEIEAEDRSYILPLKEFELFSQLAQFPDRTFTREQLIELVWGSHFTGSDRTVDVHIKRLRERFHHKGYNIRIETIRGVGYKLVTEDE